MRVRKVVTRSGKKFRGKFPSEKLGRMVHWESLLEHDAILHLECHPLVVSYQEQASVEIYYDANGIAHKYVTDLRAVLVHGTELYREVKPRGKLHKPEISRKLGAVALRFEERGLDFRVWTEEVIRREPLFSNLKTLCGGTKAVPAREAVAGLEKLKQTGSDWSFNEVVCELGSARLALSLLRTGHLHADLESKVIGAATTVWIPGAKGGNHGSFRI
jgi:hypothetical protein